MLECDTTLTQRLEQFMRGFRADFRRREQAEWAAVYLQGLLQPGGRKTIENLARTVTLPDSLPVEDAAQALQHFINQSPWDEGKLYRRHHAHVAERLLSRDGVLVLGEFTFVKQGRHSVGVQRQYSADLGRKVNCQLAVALHHLSPFGLEPLTLRLYLPRRWLEDKPRLDEAGVPGSARHPLSKTSLALHLLDEARTAGIAVKEVAAGVGWGRTDELADVVQQHGWSWRAELPPYALDTLRHTRGELQEVLGLGHFEGRSWRGFHHHTCLVVLAYSFLKLQDRGVEGD